MGHTDRPAQPETSGQSRYVIRAGDLAQRSAALEELAGALDLP